MYGGILVSVEILIIIVLNLWSKRVLTRQEPHPGGDEIKYIDERRRKRNLKAVAILNAITLVYTLSVLPASLYAILLATLLLTYEGNGELFNTLYNDFFAFVHLPLFLCSGINALVYMFKDKVIKKYYCRQLFCKKAETEKNSTTSNL